MAVPADKKTRLCDKCFATVDAGAPYCPECGAPMEGSAVSDSSDAAIYPMLARSNLLRMRGEYKQAEEVCLRILKQLPNNASAHTLLADICAERGDLEQAVEWYELALDITPDSKAEREKLASAKQRIRDREAAATAEQIGLPAKQTNFVLPAVIALVIMAAVGVSAFFLGQKATQTPKKNPVVDVSSTSGGPAIDPGTSGSNETPDTPVQPSAAWHDNQFTRFLADQSQDGKRLSDAWQDPRTQNVVVTITAAEGENARDVAASFGSAVMGQVPNASVTTVRVVQAGKLVLVADVERANWTQATSEEWKREHANDPAATTDMLLSNEWPASSSVEPSTTGAATPPSTTGTTPDQAATTGAPETTTSTGTTG